MSDNSVDAIKTIKFSFHVVLFIIVYISQCMSSLLTVHGYIVVYDDLIQYKEFLHML